MESFATTELICLYLHGASTERADEHEPGAASASELGDALGLGETMSERISLISAFDELVESGALVERTTSEDVDASTGTVYELTSAGRERAEAFHDAVLDERVTVYTDDERVDTTIRSLVDDRDRELPGTLAAVTDDGSLYLDDVVDERFVDRDAELDTFADTFDVVQEGTSQTVLVAGAAGVGKTTVVERAIENADDVALRDGQCDPDSTTPYGGLRDALGDDPFDRTADFDVSDEEEFDAQRRALFADVAEALRDDATAAVETGDVHSLVCFVDDLQWAEPETLELCEFLAHSVTDVPVLLVGAYRPSDVTEDHPLARSVEGSSDVVDTRLDLEAFDREDTHGVVQYLVGTRDVPSAFVDAVHEQTGGNALFVEETVKRTLEDGTVDPAAGVYPESLDDLDVPNAVADTIDLRFDALDEDARLVLEAVAVLGDHATQALIETLLDHLADDAAFDVASTGTHDLATTIDLLEGMRILERDGARARFTSGVLRGAVTDRIPSDRSRALHRHAANALDAATRDGPDETDAGRVDADRERADPEPVDTERERGVDYGAVATHYERAGELAAAMDAYREAGEAAQRVYAHESAIEQYRNALAIARDRDRNDVVVDVLEAIGDAALVTGQYEEAARNFRYVRERTDDVDVERCMYRKQANTQRESSEYGRAVELAKEGLELDDAEGLELDDAEGLELDDTEADGHDSDPGVDHGELRAEATEEVVHLHSERGWGYLQQGLMDEAMAAFDAEYALAKPAGDPELLSQALHDAGTAIVKQGDRSTEGIELLARAVRLREDLPDTDTRMLARTMNNLGLLHWLRSEFETAAGYIEQSLGLLEEVGDVRGRSAALGNLGVLEDGRGKFESAIEYYDRSLEIDQRIGNKRGVSIVEGNIGSALLKLGNVNEAIEHAEYAVEVADEINDRSGHASTLRSLALGRLLQCEFEEAHEYSERARDLADESGDLANGAGAHALLGEIARHEGDYDTAIEHHERAIELAEEAVNDERHANGAAELVYDYVRANDVDAATDVVETELDDLEAVTDPVIVTETQIALAAVDRLRGALEDARESIETAIAEAAARDTRVQLARATLERGRIEAAAGNVDAARERYETAETIGEDTGAVLYVRKARDLLDELGDESD